MELKSKIKSVCTYACITQYDHQEKLWFFNSGFSQGGVNAPAESRDKHKPDAMSSAETEEKVNYRKLTMDRPVNSPNAVICKLCGEVFTLPGRKFNCFFFFFSLKFVFYHSAING